VSRVKVALPPKLLNVFSGKAFVRGSYGGRGSGKTRSFAKMSAVRALMWAKAGKSGIILCGRQYMNSLDESSLEEVKTAINEEQFLRESFIITERTIKTDSEKFDGLVEYKFSGLDRNIASVKSKARILLCWVDEAEPVTEHAWEVLIPTLRDEESELWVTWNPERKGSATNKRFRDSKDPLTKCVELNYKDNPWFPDILDRARNRDRSERPDSYSHVWEGDFITTMTGAYYAASLTQAKEEGRIGFVAADPLLTHRIYCDIGGTGANSDSYTMVIAQFVGAEIRILDCYEAQGQPLATHLSWLRSKNYGPDRAQVWLPHDGSTHDKVYDVSYESAMKDAGFKVTVVPNQGKGAAMARIEETRRLFGSIRFNSASTESLRDALGFYHERRHEQRDVGLGPDHDWSSHFADAFGLMSIAYELQPGKRKPLHLSTRHII
jgi:phage terminase large subunit